jgi:hypothetical protein
MDCVADDLESVSANRPPGGASGSLLRFAQYARRSRKVDNVPSLGTTPLLRNLYRFGKQI